jgi:hypothetical protein
MANVSDAKVNPALNFRQMESSAPSYQYRNIYPANGGNRNIMLTSAGELQNTIFNLPVEVDNIGESYLEYTLNIVDQGANIYPWLFKDTYGEFNDVIFRDTGSMNIVELRNANLYSNLMNRINTSKKELEYNDDMNGLVISNAPLTDVKNKRFDNNTASLAFKEPMALQVGSIGTGSTTVYSLSVPRKIYLKDLCPDSFFGMAKNSLFPVETYLDINWIGNRLGYQGISQVDPTATNLALVTQNMTAGGNPAAVAGTYAICLSGLVLKLAVETNQELIRAMKMEVAKGLTIPIPWVKVHTLAAASASPYVYNLPLDNKQHGRKIKEIVYAPYAAAPAAASSFRLYDHCNNATAGTGATAQSVASNTKVSTYQTSLDNQYLQRDVVQCPVSSTSTLHDDYAIHKKLLKNTCYFNQPIYNQYWFHMDKFAYIDSNDNEEGSVYVDGFDLVKPVNYVVDVKTVQQPPSTTCVS